MTIISSLVVFVSLTGILSFGMWELDMEEVPILYQLGTFLASYWFHDKLKPGKPHYGNFASSGPPLVAVTGTGAARPWPYSDVNGINIGGITFEENDTERSSVSNFSTKNTISQYTPVNGLYGVSNVRENSRDKTVEYYPGAIEPNDYIAKRLLGDHADWSDLVGLGPGGDPHLWNEQVFKDGSPFGAAEIGYGAGMNSEKWALYKRYAAADPGHKLMVPLTSAGTGLVENPYFGITMESNRDYSGGEYPIGDPYYQGVNHEKIFVSDTTLTGDTWSSPNTLRPDWYIQYGATRGDKEAGAVPTNAPGIAAWAGEGGTNDGTTTYGYSKEGPYLHTLPAFYDPQVTQGAYGSGPGTYNQFFSWGIPNPTTVDGSLGWSNNKDPKNTQLDYIVTQLNTGEVGPVPVQNQGVVDVPPSITKPQSNKKRGPRSRTYSR